MFDVEQGDTSGINSGIGDVDAELFVKTVNGGITVDGGEVDVGTGDFGFKGRDFGVAGRDFGGEGSDFGGEDRDFGGEDRDFNIGCSDTGDVEYDVDGCVGDVDPDVTISVTGDFGV